MASRTRDWIKFGSLLGVAVLLGLVFTSALNLPARGSPTDDPAPESRPTTIPVVQQLPRASIPAAKPAADLGDAFVAVAQHVQPTVVFIQAERQERTTRRRLPPGFEEFFPQNRRPPVERGSGSGFIISSDGYILTNNHVVADADRVEVRLFDKRQFAAKVVGRDAATDVAVIKIDATDLPAATLGNSDSTRIGEWVLAIGNPFGENFTFTVTAGIVSAKGRLLRGLEAEQYSIHDFIQTDAAINPGNSGGPLVDVHGDVIGINSAIASETGSYAGYGFAIPINLARIVTEQLIARGYVERAVLGISIRDAGEEDAAAVGLDRIRGVVVQDYSFGDRPDASPAKKAGIQPGDVIVALDGDSVEYVAQLQQRVGFKKPGETVRVTVLREGGQRRSFNVRLAAAPQDRTDVATRNEPSGNDAGNEGVREDRLGIAFQPLSEDQVGRSARLREILEQGGGLVVTAVAPDGPAYRRLFAEEDGGPDIIVRLNDQAVGSRADLTAALRGTHSGDIVTLYVLTRGLNWSQRVVRIRIP